MYIRIRSRLGLSYWLYVCVYNVGVLWLNDWIGFWYKRKKERKSIYIALFWPRWYIQSAQAWITQFYLQITPCLPFLRERSPDGITTATEATDIQLQLTAYKGCHRGQLLCIWWDPHPLTERKTFLVSWSNVDMMKTVVFIMGAPWNRAGHYIFILWFLDLSSFFFSSPNLSRRRLDVYHTSTHGVTLVRI